MTGGARKGVRGDGEKVPTKSPPSVSRCRFSNARISALKGNAILFFWDRNAILVFETEFEKQSILIP